MNNFGMLNVGRFIPQILTRRLKIVDAIREHNENLLNNPSEYPEITSLVFPNNFHGHVCKVCNSIENIKLCARCKMVPYCGEEHQTSDWPTHKILCPLLRKISDTIDFLLQFSTRVKISDIVTESRRLLGNIYETIPTLEASYYETLILFPKICALCCSKKINTNFYCQKCFAKGYCSLEHMTEHVGNHSKVCSGLQLCRQFGHPHLNVEATEQKFRSALSKIDWSKLTSLKQFPENYEELMNIIFGKDFEDCIQFRLYQIWLNNHLKEEFPNETLQERFVYCKVGDYFSPVGTIIHYMKRLGLLKDIPEDVPLEFKKKSLPSCSAKPVELIIFFIGMGGHDLNFLDVIDGVLKAFVKTPLLPKFYFIGQGFENGYYKRNSDFSFYSKITWVPFHLVDCVGVLPTPDLLVIFNLHMGKNSIRPHPKDELHQILSNSAISPHWPILITTSNEEYINNVFEFANRKYANILVGPEENPFASKIPYICSGTINNCPDLFYANSYAVVVSKS